jgi:enoyl-CoA hydratase/carnithine racemase
MKTSPILLETRDDNVALVTLNRPDRGNAWNPEMESMYFEVLRECVDRADIRAVVIFGAGRSWCVGADIDIVGDASRSGGDLRADQRPDPRETAAMPIPIIAAINGGCAGRGLVQALYCDVRFAARGAKFSTSFARRGLSAEYAISWILPRIAGVGAALDLLVSGRVFTAEEALRLGLLNQVLEPDELLGHALTYASDLARHCSPTAMAAIKGQVWGDLERTWTEATERARRLMEVAVTGPDLLEGIESFIQKRPPSFPATVAEWARPPQTAG